VCPNKRREREGFAAMMSEEPKDIADLSHRGAQAASLHRPAACRTECSARLKLNLASDVCGKLPQTADWQPALPGKIRIGRFT
jgi:hypothetical protein